MFKTLFITQVQKYALFIENNTLYKNISKIAQTSVYNEVSEHKKRLKCFWKTLKSFQKTLRRFAENA